MPRDIGLRCGLRRLSILCLRLLHPHKNPVAMHVVALMYRDDSYKRLTWRYVHCQRVLFISMNENVCIDVGRVHAPRVAFTAICHAVRVVQAAGVWQDTIDSYTAAQLSYLRTGSQKHEILNSSTSALIHMNVTPLFSSAFRCSRSNLLARQHRCCRRSPNVGASFTPPC